MIKVAVTDNPFGPLDLESKILEPLGCQLDARVKAPPPDELVQLVADAEYVMTVFASITPEIIAAMRKAKLIVRYGVGVDNIDLEAARARQIPVCNVPDYCMDEVADHTLALILAMTRQLVPNCIKLRGGTWGLAVPHEAMKPLSELTVGVIGCGRIGREVVQRLRPFKCRIAVHDPALAPVEVRSLGGEPVDFEAVLQASDILTLHCPSIPQTYRIVNRETIAMMKPGAILINVGRGTLVDPAALVDALEAGHLAGAGLDVFDPEPLPADSPLLTRERVVVSPHVAAVSVNAVRTLRETAANLVALAIRGEPLRNVVNGVKST